MRCWSLWGSAPSEDGAGSFSAAAGSPRSVGSTPRSVAIGNLNGDGNPDLAITNEGSGNVSVLLGNGAGVFTAAAGSPISVGSSPFGIAIGNLDGGSVPDLVVGSLDNNVLVLLGNGNGTFGAKTDFPTGTKPQSVAIANLNGGSNPDLAVATAGPDAAGPDDVSVLLGSGTETFGPATDFPAAADPLSVAVGNFNADSLPDLVTANSGSGSVSILLGTSGPTANAAPARLDFASQDQGTTSAAQTVTVTNISDDDEVEVSGATVTAQDAADFDIASETCSATSLPPAGTCEMEIAFTPSDAGQRFSALQIAFNGAASPLTVNLAGIGAEECPEFTTGNPPSCVELKARISRLTVTGPAKLRKGKPSIYKEEITNSGNARATGVELIVTGRGIRSGAPVGKVNAGATRAVNLRLRPARTGRIKATFKVTSSNAGTKTVKKKVRVR